MMIKRAAWAVGTVVAAGSFDGQDDVMLMQEVRRQDLISIDTGIGGAEALTMEHYPSGLVRAMNASLLQEAAASAGIRWSLTEAEQRSSMLRHDEVVILLQPPRAGRVSIKDSCSAMKSGGDEAGCGAAVSAGVANMVPFLWSPDKINLASATKAGVDIAIAAGSMYCPVCGMVATMFSGVILGLLFPEEASNEMREARAEVLKIAGGMMDRKIMLADIDDLSVELLEIERQLDWMRHLLNEIPMNPTEVFNNTMLSFTLMIYADLATVTAKIRSRKVSRQTPSAADDERRWAYFMMPIATWAMMMQNTLLIELASFDDSFKSHIAQQLKRLMITDTSPPSWSLWIADMAPVVNALIKDEFTKINWTAKVWAKPLTDPDSEEYCSTYLEFAYECRVDNVDAMDTNSMTSYDQPKLFWETVDPNVSAECYFLRETVLRTDGTDCNGCTIPEGASRRSNSANADWQGRLPGSHGYCDCVVPSEWEWQPGLCNAYFKNKIRDQIQGQFDEFKTMFAKQIQAIDPHLCAGKTIPGATDWKVLGSSGTGFLYLDVDTSKCKFTETPIYVTALQLTPTGVSVVAEASSSTGSSEIYSPTATGFRIQLNIPFTPDGANSQKLAINWIAGSAQQPVPGVCEGQAANWIGSSYIVHTVNTSHCNFAARPVYVTSMQGASLHYTTTGSSEVYAATASSFKQYINGATPAQAALYDYKTNYIAVDAADSSKCSCAGRTSENDWVKSALYGDNIISVAVDISKCGFKTTPVIVSSLHGQRQIMVSTGSTELYMPTATTFTIFIVTTSNIVSLERYRTWKWSIEWVAVEDFA